MKDKTMFQLFVEKYGKCKICGGNNTGLIIDDYFIGEDGYQMFYKRRFPIVSKCENCGSELYGYSMEEMLQRKDYAPLYCKATYKFIPDVLQIWNFDINSYVKEMYFCVKQIRKYEDLNSIQRKEIEYDMVKHTEYVLDMYFKLFPVKRQQSKYQYSQHTNCIFCNSTDKLEYHHIIPVKYGGSSELSNIASLCIACHDKLHHFQDKAIKHVIDTTR